jgi:hypothetical protein
MIDTPIDAKIKTGLKVQAKLTAIAILHSLIYAGHKPIPEDRIKGLADVVYSALCAMHYQEQSASAQEFVDFHAKEMADFDWEPELVQGMEA